MALLHTHGGAEAGILAFLEEVLLHGVIDTLKLIPFLFLTYLLMEYIEHRAEEKAERFMSRAGSLGPLIGGTLGAVPQCGFSAAAANLYAGRVITVGTLIAVFLSTSDEMLPILIAGNIKIGSVLLIVLYKSAVGILVGFTVDAILRALLKNKEKINIDAICDEDNCHCERGILHSAIHHTVTITMFVLLITLAINALVFFVGEERLGALMYDKPFVSHLIASLIGLIPNCAASVALASLFSGGIITVGTMMAGLFSGAGVGLLVLFKVNRRLRDNLIIMLVLVCVGIAFGMIADLIFPAVLFAA